MRRQYDRRIPPLLDGVGRPRLPAFVSHVFWARRTSTVYSTVLFNALCRRTRTRRSNGATASGQTDETTRNMLFDLNLSDDEEEVKCDVEQAYASHSGIAAQHSATVLTTWWRMQLAKKKAKHLRRKLSFFEKAARLKALEARIKPEAVGSDLLRAQPSVVKTLRKVKLPARCFRHRAVLRDNLQGISKPAIRRLARRGGVKRISGLIYEDIRQLLKVFVQQVLHDSIAYTEHAHRKTVSVMDVKYALKRQGRTLYGWGCA